MTARRTRRISSSLLPENMTPAITSMRPGRVPCCMPEPWVDSREPRLGAWERGGRVVSRGGWVKETQLSCGFSGDTPILWWFYAAFPAPRAKKGRNSKASPGSRPLTRRYREQSRADRCAGDADEDVQGRREPDDRSPVRRQGHHRRRAEEGRQGADHGVWEFRSAQAGRADGPQSQDGRRDPNQGVDCAGVPRRKAAEDGREQPEITHTVGCGTLITGRPAGRPVGVSRGFRQGESQPAVAVAAGDGLGRSPPRSELEQLLGAAVGTSAPGAG